MAAHYDIAILGLGPAGATLARLLDPAFSVLALDRKRQNGGFCKPCGGLLAPDAQKAMARLSLSLPSRILVDPQIFSVRTFDIAAGLRRDYQRCYLNMDRHAFDLWLMSLIPDRVDVRKGAVCSRLERCREGYRLFWREDGEERQATASRLVGADGAFSLVRRTLFPHARIRAYTAIQQWFADRHPRPFLSCLFDAGITDCYAWGLTKGDFFIFGGAFSPRHARKAFELLKQKAEQYGFLLEHPIRTEACAVLRPVGPGELLCGGEGAFLVGEAAGFVSPSSLEGISYALESAEALADALNARHPEAERAYLRNTRSLRLRLLEKTAKSPFIFYPPLRRLIMASGIGSINIR